MLKTIKITRNKVEQIGGPLRVCLKDGRIFTVIHNPKTAGTSINKWIEYEFNKGKLIESIEHIHGHVGVEKCKLAFGDLGFVFTVVRNPYVKFISFWNHYQNLNNNFIKLSFEEYWESGAVGWRQIPQSYYWKGCDLVIRYENLKQELNEKISSVFFSKSSNLPRWNFFKRSYETRDVGSILPKKIRDEIFDLDKETFEKFGYEKDVR